MKTVTTTPLRGDQQPQFDDDDIDEIVPLDSNHNNKYRPVTVLPTYVVNNYDRIDRRIELS